MNRDRALQFFNRLLPVLVSGSNSVRTLTGVPLCEGTAIVLSRELERRPDFLRNLAIDIVRESLDDNHTPTVGEHHAPRFARALKNMQKLECLSINFSEVYYFSTGEAYFRALSGSFPVSLRQLELNNVGPLLLGISTTISSVIEQSGLNLDSFIFANCKFGDIFPSVLRSLRTKRTTLRVLHFDDLNELTTPRLSDFLTRHEFPCSKELGIGITARVNILTDFCMSLGEHEGIEEIDLVDGPKDWMECKRDTLSLFEALAVMMKKLPNLRSMSTSDMGRDGLNFKPFKCPPSAFMEAVEKHSHLTKLSYALLRMMTPSARHKFEYFALSNQYKDHLTGSKFQVFEAFEKISKKAQFGANVVTLAFETIRQRDDLLRDGGVSNSQEPSPVTSTNPRQEMLSFTRPIHTSHRSYKFMFFLPSI